MKVPIRIYNHVSGRFLFTFHSIGLTGCPLAASQPPQWYDLLTGSGEYGGRLEEKIEEGPRDLPKCTRLELSPAFCCRCFESITVHPTEGFSGLYPRSKNLRPDAAGA
jgi:hypothetical protein